MLIEYLWCGEIDNDEVNALHAEAFETRLFSADEWDWISLLARHDARLVGFVNVIWDGAAHAWVQDTMVGSQARGQGLGTSLVAIARDEARKAGCEWLHVDFDDDLGRFYYEACGFRPTSAGLIHLKPSE
jgi:GNAT superfamily N-acetyltransferase